MFDVAGNGPSDSKLVIVSDFPNPDEMNSKQALVGKVGNSVAYGLKQVGVKLDDCYKTQIIKTCRDGFFKQKKNEREKELRTIMDEVDYIRTLKAELAMVQPNAILALGEHSLNVLCDLKGIDNYRGSILKLDPRLKLPATIKVIPTLHPRQVWQRTHEEPLVNFDYARAVQKSKNNFEHKSRGLLWYTKNANELKRYWDRGKKGEFLVFDIETWRGYITCIGFCTNGHEAVSVPLFDYPTIADRVSVWRQISDILQHPMPKVNQNIKYDLHYLEKWGFRVENVVGDTSLAARCIYPEFNVRLSILQSIYTEIPYHKDEGHDYSPTYDRKEQLYLYNAKDCLSTWQVHKGQLVDLEELGVTKFYNSNYWENRLFHIYRQSDNRGILIDAQQRSKLVIKYEDSLDRHKFAVEDAYGQKLNINSPKQVAEFVYEYLECPKIWKKANDSGERSLDTGKEALEELYINKVKKESVKVLLKRIIIVRKLQKILSYLHYAEHPDGRMRASTKLNGTKSGRTSQTTHEDSYFFTTKNGKVEYASFGGSLQVIPKRPFEAEEFEGEVFGSDISSIFVPTPGYIFVEGDGGAAEARVVCVLSSDFETLEAMDKIDIHKLTATWTTGHAFEAITSYEREIYGKRPRHAGNYDMGAYRLSSMIHKPVNLCQQILDSFHEKAPKIRGIFHMFVRQYVDNTRTLTSPHGRHHQFFGRKCDALYKEAYSFIPQATVSDHVKFTMPLVLADVPSVQFLLEKHDSLLMEVPVEDKEKLLDCFQKHMERPISFKEGSFKRDFELVIPAEVKWSDENWLNMKKVKRG